VENKCIKPNQQPNLDTPVWKKIKVFMLYNTCLPPAPFVEQKYSPEMKIM
jgi:hypothetical protein